MNVVLILFYRYHHDTSCKKSVVNCLYSFINIDHLNLWYELKKNTKYIWVSCVVSRISRIAIIKIDLGKTANSWEYF